MLASSKKTALSKASTEKLFPAGDLTRLADPLQNLTFLPNGQMLVVSRGRDYQMSLWGLDERACVRPLSGKGSFYHPVVLPNGMLAYGSDNVERESNAIIIWDITTDRRVATLTGHSGRVTCLAVLPNGQLVSGSDDKSIKIWDIEQLRCVATFRRAHSDKVRRLVVARNGQLVSGSASGSIKVWNLFPGLIWGVRGTCVRILKEHRTEIDSLAFLPNGQLVSGAIDSIKVWDIAKGLCLDTIQYKDGFVTSLAVLPNGLVASCHYKQNKIMVWSTTDKCCIGALHGHTEEVGHLVVLPNGQLLSGAANTLKIWPFDLQSVLQPVSDFTVTSNRTAPSTQGSDLLRDNIKHLSHTNLQFRKDAIATFVSLSIKAENRRPIVEAGAIPPIVRLLADPDRLVAGNAIKALWNLSIDDANKATIAEAGAIQPLVQFLGSADRSMKESALRALRNLSCHRPSTLRIAQAGAIPPLVQCLGDAETGIRQSAVGALRNLCYGEDQWIAIAQAGAIPPLVRLLQDSDTSVRTNAVLAINGLTCNVTNQIAFAQAGAIPHLVRLFDDENEETRTSAGFSLGNIGENPANYAAMVDANASIVLRRFMALSEHRDRKKYIQDVLIALQSFVGNQSKPVVREAKPSASPYLSSSGGLVVIPSHELQIQAKLGEGGFGVVSKALWQGTTLVALKQLSSPYLPDAMLAEFRQEAEIHSSLRHPNIVILYGVCLEHMKYALVMELMVKGSLYGVLNSTEALPWSRRIGIALDAMAGLCFLHERSIVHRDLKSMNILLDANGAAKLADFGLAKVKNASSTTTAGAVGTLYWMAPELFRMNGQCSKATDIYAMGMVLWEIAARKLPYQSSGGNQALVMQWVKEGEREDIPDATPPGIARLITQCWAARPEQRPASARVVIDALKAEQYSPVAAATETGYQQFSAR